MYVKYALPSLFNYESKGIALEQARYQEIAMKSLAIVLGEYHEGDKILNTGGRLSRRFNVFSETIRRL
jgi:hypothetical protein